MPEEKKKPAKSKKRAVQPLPFEEQVVDYSQHFRSFYDIFVGYFLDAKNFDLQYAIRDNRNMFATFVNIMDVNS